MQKREVELVRMNWFKNAPLTHSPLLSSHTLPLSVRLLLCVVALHYPLRRYGPLRDDGFIVLPDYKCDFTDPLPEHVFIYLVDVDPSVMGLHDGDGCILTSTDAICDPYGSGESAEVIIKHTELLRFIVWLWVPTDVDSSESRESTNPDSDSTDPDYKAFLGNPYGTDSGDIDTDPSDPSDQDGSNDDDSTNSDIDPASDPADPPTYLIVAAPAEPAYSDSDTVDSDSDDDDSTSSDTGSDYDGSDDSTSSYAGSVATQL